MIIVAYFTSNLIILEYQSTVHPVVKEQCSYYLIQKLIPDLRKLRINHNWLA